MRLDFTILWIDDDQKHVKGFSEGLAFHLRDLGFELRVERVEQLDKVDAAIGSHVHNDAIDLVLVDYDLGLGGGDGGEQALVKVRRRFPFKEVVFYSATDAEKLRKIAFDAKVDGILFSTRLSLVDDTVQVIRKLLSKVLDLDHMRGVVMSASSDIDFLVERSLLAVYLRLPPEEQSAFRVALSGKVEKKLQKWGDELKAASAKGDIGELFKLKHLFTSMERLDSLLDQLAAWSTDNSSHVDKLKVYRNSVVPKRNQLAHVMLKREPGQAPELVGTKGSWTVDDMTDLRRLLIEHRVNFQTIAILVDATLA